MKKLLYSLAFLALAPLAWWLAQRDPSSHPSGESAKRSLSRRVGGKREKVDNQCA